jgi:hypothetical protein
MSKKSRCVTGAGESRRSFIVRHGCCAWLLENVFILRHKLLPS